MHPGRVAGGENPSRAANPAFCASPGLAPGTKAGENRGVDGDKRLRLEIRGAVQGVGFRPFVYRLARELALRGWVVNDSRGVLLEVEGPGDRVESFHARLPEECPPLAVLLAVEPSWHEPAG